MTKQRIQTGAVGEQIACDFLQESGYRIVERNHRSRMGELDIIAEYEEFLVFCEVKTRRGTGVPHPSLSVTAKKIAVAFSAVCKISCSMHSKVPADFVYFYCLRHF